MKEQINKIKDNNRYHTIQGFSLSRQYDSKSNKAHSLLNNYQITNKKIYNNSYDTTRRKNIKQKVRIILQNKTENQQNYKLINIKSGSILNQYGEFSNNQEQLWMKDYLNQCHKSQQHKQHVLDLLRNKLVQKYPKMRKYYTDYILQQQTIQKSKQSKQLNQLLLSRKSHSLHKNQPHSNNIVNKNMNGIINKDAFKIGYFYSRSKRRCMTSFYPYQQQSQQKINIEIPKLNYLQYRKIQVPFRVNKKIKAGMMKKLLKNQPQILNIQRQGTKAYNILKQCFDQAIENAMEVK